MERSCAAARRALPHPIEPRGGTDRVVTFTDPAAAASLGVAFRVDSAVVDLLPELIEVAERVDNGEIAIELARAFALTSTAAHELPESGRPGGKILTDPS